MKETDKNTGKEADHGCWRSPISPQLITGGSIGLGDAQAAGERLFWLETRPTEGGRNVIVEYLADGPRDMLPAPFSARTRVHEYGGGAWLATADALYFSNFADQQIYRLPLDDTDGAESATTPQPVTRHSDWRFADFAADPARNRLIAIAERHDTDGEPANLVVAIDLRDGTLTRLAEGADFYSSPRLSPDGGQLAFICWDHPDMPWDGTRLMLARLDTAGDVTALHTVGGGREDAICQPAWGADDALYFCSDRTDWWNIYRLDPDTSAIRPVTDIAAEIGAPHWVFGQRHHLFLDDGSLLLVINERGHERLARRLADGTIETVAQPFTSLGSPCLWHRGDGSTRIVLAAASATRCTELVALDMDSGRFDTLRQSFAPTLDPDYLSVPEAIEYPTSGNRTAHAFYYPPANPDFKAPAGTRPPLIVKLHGGPTSQATAALNLQIQYWTSRGFALVDINYSGSSGYGRAYRERLAGQWGVADLDDAEAAVRHLAAQDRIDAARVAIRGGSAGGYSALAALTFRDAFSVGASYYGISDLEALARDTHKFESRYIDKIVAPYPAAREVFVARSPLHHIHRLARPLIFFQGLEDQVVPPNQAEMMVDALRAKGLPVAYLPFAGEQHGFRQAKNIRRALEAELYFYGRVFGFEPADEIEPVTIHNLD